MSEATTSEATMSETLLQELLEREAIKELKARYLRLADAHDWEAWRDVFTDDLHAQLMDGRPIEGADNFVAFIRKIIDKMHTVHHAHNPELTIDGPTDAHGTWAFADYLESPADPETGERKAVNGYGRYHETYRKVDGVWKIASLHTRYRAAAPNARNSTRRAAGTRSGAAAS